MPQSDKTTGLFPFDDIKALFAEMPGFDEKAARLFAQNNAGVLKPGMIQNICMWMTGWQGQVEPRIRRPVVAVFAASHKAAASFQCDKQIGDIQSLLETARDRSASVAAACEKADLGLKVFELAPEMPVDDFTSNASLEESDCAATIAYGMEATTDGCDLLMVRAEAAGSCLATAAISAALLGLPDTSNASHSAQYEAVKTALETHKSHLQSPLEILRRCGGREMAATAGAIIAARLQRVPVILDGSAAICTALLLETLHNGAAAHCYVSACDTHPDCERLVSALGRPVLLAGHYDRQDAVSGAFAAGLVRSSLDFTNSASETGV